MKNTVFTLILGLIFLLLCNLILAQNDTNDLKDTYDFDYIYKVEMTNKKNTIQFDYYLTEDAGYFGFVLPTINKDEIGMDMFTTIDNDNEITAMFMEMMGKKMVKTSKIKLSDFDYDTDDSEYKITEIGSKTILGFECDGFIMENKESEITVHITNEAPVSFNKIWDNGKNKMPKGFNPSWM